MRKFVQIVKEQFLSIAKKSFIIVRKR